MSTSSTLLSCTGAAAGLAAVWMLAGLSERSTLRVSARVGVVAAVGLVGEAVVYGRATSGLRSELALALLFGVTSVLALVVGAAKLEGALYDNSGARAVRRSTGVVSGTFLGMAAVGAATLGSSGISLAQARVGWALMFPLVAGALAVFIDRPRYAGVGWLASGRQWLLAPLVGGALLVGARFQLVTAAPMAARVAARAPAAAVVAPAASIPNQAALALAPQHGAADAASAAPPERTAPIDKLLIDGLKTRGMVQSDVLGGVRRRMDRLLACSADPKNQQSGALALKVGIDQSGSVSYARATGGDLVGTPLADCLLPAFYKMGFAAPASNGAHFEITLRVANTP